LRDWIRSEAVLLTPDEQEAEALIDRYRHQFEVPLTKVVMGLRSFLATEGELVLVGQRLKRRPRIIDKLGRHPTMRLTEMQDIAGARAVLSGLDAVERVRRRIERAAWDVVTVDDYNGRPKATGYRALHVVVRRDATLVEVQLRTGWQEDWSQSVERIDARYGLTLKDGEGPDVLLRYLERIAYALDLTHRHEALERRLNADLDVLGQEAAEWLRRMDPKT
jgi:ppGpp synthetase/RelA/SpoT-type nucleotidyltranferase